MMPIGQMMEPDDITLMLQVRDGSVEAFRALVVRWRLPLRRFFASVIADPSLADDFAQETFLRLWILRDRYEATGRFSAYLFQIARFYWHNQRKRYRPETPLDDLDVLRIAAPRVSQPEVVLLSRHRAERIRRAIAALPDRYRLVFSMSHLEGRSYAEIACALSIPLGTVKSRMAEATRRLRHALEGDDDAI